MHVHRTPARDSMGASDKRVEMKGKVSVSGLLRGLAALHEHKCLLYHQNWLRTCLPTCWHRVSFPKFILEGFSPISDKNSSGLVQAKSARPKASTQILELMLSHLKKVLLQEHGCSETTDKLMGTLTGSYNLWSDMKISDRVEDMQEQWIILPEFWFCNNRLGNAFSMLQCVRIFY